jgi:hypothetical protein
MFDLRTRARAEARAASIKVPISKYRGLQLGPLPERLAQND